MNETIFKEQLKKIKEIFQCIDDYYFSCREKYENGRFIKCREDVDFNKKIYLTRLLLIQERKPDSEQFCSFDTYKEIRQGLQRLEMFCELTKEMFPQFNDYEISRIVELALDNKNALNITHVHHYNDISSEPYNCNRDRSINGSLSGTYGISVGCSNNISVGEHFN